MSQQQKKIEYPKVDESVYTTPHKLLEFQDYVIDFEAKNPESRCYYLIRVNKYHKENLNIPKFVEAANKATKHFQSYNMTYIKVNGEVMQIYKPELFKPIVLEKMTEEEVQNVVEHIYDKKFNIYGGPLIDFRIIETDKYMYYVQRHHHTIIDGNGILNYYKTLQDFYADREPYPDFYLKILDDYDKYVASQEYKDMEKFYMDKYMVDGLTCYPKFDNASKVDYVDKDGKQLNNLICRYFQINGLSKVLNELFKDKPYLYNTFFVMAGILHIAETTGKRDIIYCWDYHGRDTPLRKISSGFFVREYPTRVILKDKINVQELCNEMSNQSRELLHKPFFPFTLKYMEKLIAILFQHKLEFRSKFNGNIVKELVPTENISWQDEPTDCDYLDISYYQHDDGYDVEFLACPFRYTEEGFKKYIEDFTKCCFNLVKYWDSKEYIDIHQLFV